MNIYKYNKKKIIIERKEYIIKNENKKKLINRKKGIYNKKWKLELNI